MDINKNIDIIRNNTYNVVESNINSKNCLNQIKKQFEELLKENSMDNKLFYTIKSIKLNPYIFDYLNNIGYYNFSLSTINDKECFRIEFEVNNFN